MGGAGWAEAPDAPEGVPAAGFATPTRPDSPRLPSLNSPTPRPFCRSIRGACGGVLRFAACAVMEMRADLCPLQREVKVREWNGDKIVAGIVSALVCGLGLASCVGGSGDAGGNAGQGAADSADVAADTEQSGSDADPADGGSSAGSDAEPGGTDTAQPAGTDADAGSPDQVAEDVVLADTAAPTDVTEPGGPLTPQDWGPSYCPTAGPTVGYAVGERLGAIKVVDCDTGEPRSLDELCGAEALWLFVAHSHCPTCKGTASITPDLATEFAPQGVAVAHVVYIDDSQTCPSWRTKYKLDGHPNVRVYRDPTGAAFSAIKTSNYTAPHLFATSTRVITHKQHGLSSSGVRAQIKKALSQP